MPSTQTTTGSMTIGELSQLTGLSASAIRFYQRRGVLPSRDDADSGWQRFGDDTLNRLAIIELVKSAGFSLDEVIRIMDALHADPDAVPDETPVWHGLAECKIRDIDALIVRLEQTRDLLQDALTIGYLPPDLTRQVPGLLGWTAPDPQLTPLVRRRPATTR
jgi:MerR family redox-sensitive transcriptional activator SoxR